jgi:hypothetical protein
MKKVKIVSVPSISKWLSSNQIDAYIDIAETLNDAKITTICQDLTEFYDGDDLTWINFSRNLKSNVIYTFWRGDYAYYFQSKRYKDALDILKSEWKNIQNED